MPILYKGASPDTHWHRTDPRHTGFIVSGGQPHSPSLVTQHISYASHPSPYLSFTLSYAVAREYGRIGATRRKPGFVYAVDTALDPTLRVLDPVLTLAQAYSPIHEHDGCPKLVPAIASKGTGHAARVLTAPPARLSTLPRPPSWRNELQAVIYSLRDAEILVHGAVPSTCITQRFTVW
jgi:hypothetical protein